MIKQADGTWSEITDTNTATVTSDQPVEVKQKKTTL
jgi:hypothetical protein